MIGRSLITKTKASLARISQRLTGPIYHYQYYPYCGIAPSYMMARSPTTPEGTCEQGLPIPPEDVRIMFRDPERFLSTGKSDVARMSEIVKAAGYSIGDSKRILDFGCGAGRMTRWLKEYSAESEIWGSDLSGNTLFWCSENLTPPFNFVLTTTTPHLPFEDKHFDFIFAGSVFTHLDDLGISWLLELRRVLSDKGRVYITLHDSHTLELMKGEYKDHPLTTGMNADPNFRKYVNSNYGMFTIGRCPSAQVFYDTDYFRQRISPFFKIVAHEKAAYRYQSAVVLGRS